MKKEEKENLRKNNIDGVHSFVERVRNAPCRFSEEISVALGMKIKLSVGWKIVLVLAERWISGTDGVVKNCRRFSPREKIRLISYTV